MATSDEPKPACFACGDPIKYEPGNTWVRCPKCTRTYRVWPPGVDPDRSPLWRRPAIMLGALLILATAVGFLVAYRHDIVHLSPPRVSEPDPTHTPKPLPSKFRSILGSDSRYVHPFSRDLCWVRGNDDGVPDLALWHGGWSDARLIVIDGKSGRGLWATRSLPHMADSFLHCANDSTVVVGLGDFSVKAYDAQDGSERWTKKLTDIPYQSAPGDGCILIQTKDNTQTGLRLSDGHDVQCVATGKPSNYHLRLRPKGNTPTKIGDLDVFLTERESGTPMLSLTAKRLDDPMWNTELGVYSNTPYAMSGLFAHTREGIFVAGRVPSGGIDVRLMGVSPQNGQVIWQRGFEHDEGAHNNPASISLLEVRGERLYAGAAGRLRAIEPQTGKDLWLATMP